MSQPRSERDDANLPILRQPGAVERRPWGRVITGPDGRPAAAEITAHTAQDLILPCVLAPGLLFTAFVWWGMAVDAPGLYVVGFLVSALASWFSHQWYAAPITRVTLTPELAALLEAHTSGQISGSTWVAVLSRWRSHPEAMAGPVGLATKTLRLASPSPHGPQVEREVDQLLARLAADPDAEVVPVTAALERLHESLARWADAANAVDAAAVRQGAATSLDSLVAAIDEDAAIQGMVADELGGTDPSRVPEDKAPGMMAP